MNSTQWLNRVMDTVYHNPATTFYIGLSSTLEKKEDGSIEYLEPTTDLTGYRRVNVGNLSNAENGIIVNLDDIIFPESTASWWDGQVQAAYWVLFDGEYEGATALSGGSLDTPHYIERNTIITIPAGLLTITLLDYDAIA